MKVWLLVLVVAVLAALDVVVAKQDITPNPRVVSQADQRTVGDQSNRPADVLTTKRIRNELMNDEALSMKAKNIKIITVNNGVTLKGNVNSADERERILKHAYITAPKHKIYNQLSVIR
ncbi:MAG: BON domain-containing protein [Bacteriovorax sp.]|nr:BON domain-containing protein [Bacteriovorax sp.]